MLLPVVLVVLGLIWFAYDSGLEFAGLHRGQTQRELDALRARVAVLSEQNAKYGVQLATLSRQLQIETGKSQEMSRQLKDVSEENAGLQDDLNVFQNMSAGKEGELAIHRLTLARDGVAGEYVVRMLLVQSGQRVGEFAGGYQLLASVVQNGRKSVMVFPSDPSGLSQFSLKFKYYQRLERSFKLAPDVQLQSVQVRLFESGGREPKVRQSVDLL